MMVDAFVVTANRTLDGGVVYLRSDRTWSGVLSDAHVAESVDALTPLLAWARTREAEVCDPYSLQVGRAGDLILPLSARERIRAEGPRVTLTRLGYA